MLICPGSYLIYEKPEDSDMNSTLLHIIVSTLAIALVFFIANRRHLSYDEDLGLIVPSGSDLLKWGLLFLLLIGAEELAIRYFGGEPASSWIGKYTHWEMAWRMIGILFLAPIAEELMLRGLIFSRIRDTRLKVWGAIILPAVLFSLAHVQYSYTLTFIVIFIDGLFFGLVRHFSKSVVLCIVLHAVGNLVAVFEKLI